MRSGPGRSEQDAADLDRQIRRVVVRAVVAARLATTVMVAFGVAAGLHQDAFPRLVPALATYGTAIGWSLLLSVVVARSERLPRAVLGVDVVVLAVLAALLPWFADRARFEELVNPDLEPLAVSAALTVALVTGSGRATAAACTILAAGFLAAIWPTGFSLDGLAAAVGVSGWQIGTGYCGLLFIQRLNSSAAVARRAADELLAVRERAAARRAQAQEQARQLADRMHRYRLLHDGPIRTLTALAGPGPAGHPDPAVRHLCAIGVNVLRGATSDEDSAPLTDLSLALVEAGNRAAPLGLRVEYHFSALPADLPAPVIGAIRLAAEEALFNVAQHAGVTRARLTASSVPDRPAPAVRVAVVDQGHGFEPGGTVAGHGIRRSIVDRLVEVGGAATVDSHPGEGTRVDLRWPR